MSDHPVLPRSRTDAPSAAIRLGPLVRAVGLVRIPQRGCRSRIALLCGALALAAPASAPALEYADSSPSGAAFPQWDGGDTELEFADVNGDGHVDFVSIGDHGSPYINTDQHGVMVYFGDGHGGWSIHMEGNFGYGGVAIGDVDGDGLLDVGYGMHHDYSGTDFGDQLIEVALGDGTGTAWTPWDDGLATSGESWGMFATDFADIDLDGDLDLASNSFGCCNGVHVYRNEGDGTWTQSWAMSGGNSTAQLCFGDVNGDGAPDIAAAYQNGTVFLGDGEGGFTVADAGLPGGGSLGRGGVSLGDVDGDGCADLSFVNQGGVVVCLWRGDHWEPSSSGLPATGDYEITLLRDMNVDGSMDVAAMGEGFFSVWLGDGTGAWIAGGGFDSGPANSTQALAVGGDIDHNGYPDVALVEEQGSWPSYRNYLYVYRETSTPGARFVRPVFPRGAETWVAGSVQTIRWAAAQIGSEPASIDLELSVTGPGGPWTPIATGIPDGGHHQWTVAGAPTEEARIRITLSQAGEEVSALSGAFRITPGGMSGVAAGGAPGSMRDRRVRLRLAANPARGEARFELLDLADDPAAGRPAALGGDAGGPTLAIYAVSGRLIRRLPLTASPIVWDLRAGDGRRVADGVYLTVLRAAPDDRVLDVRRLVVLR